VFCASATTHTSVIFLIKKENSLRERRARPIIYYRVVNFRERRIVYFCSSTRRGKLCVVKPRDEGTTFCTLALSNPETRERRFAPARLSRVDPPRVADRGQRRDHEDHGMLRRSESRLLGGRKAPETENARAIV